MITSQGQTEGFEIYLSSSASGLLFTKAQNLSIRTENPASAQSDHTLLSAAYRICIMRKPALCICAKTKA